MSSCYVSTVAHSPHVLPLLLLPPTSDLSQAANNSSLRSFYKHKFCSERRVSCRGGSQKGGLIAVQSYGTSPLSSSYSVSSAAAEEERKVGENASVDGGLELLVCENGWRVRRMVDNQSEMRKVARVQAEAFHEPAFFFDNLFFYFFEAEVLAALLYRVRNSPPNRYACLIAEPKASESESQREVVGVVDLTVSREDDVLQHVQGEDEFLYVSGIAVSKKFRRQKVATALLKACEMLSILWGFKYLALRAYENDLGARTLYTNAGYQVVSADPHWNTTWIGRKRRVLMVKQCSFNVSM